MRPFPLILGPTAGGKSTLAVDLALALRDKHNQPAEIITADSMQIYKGMDIGTAKPTPEERRGVPHHLLDLIEPTEPFSVDQWLDLANPLIDELRSRNIIPIVVGGTNLYVKALLEGLFEGPPANESLRAELSALPREELRARLLAADPIAAQRIHPNDTRRTIRTLEVFAATGKPISELQEQWDTGRVRQDALPVFLDWPTELINPRINARVKAMFEQGFESEARTLWQSNRLGPQAREALGYKQLIEHFEDRATLEGAVEEIKIQTRRFAKNQRTWLRRLSTIPGSLRIACDDSDAMRNAAELVASRLKPELR
ncbi:MAG TPA: tRNA (adenosine(37)-N6)-dimethylallyltransferase MiaA [Phycisphaerales bacterium]|nr:tRNA (adenosine(37)-N6)-dimethylallyltransferase MiaA [Phycisphaerales bacterium]